MFREYLLFKENRVTVPCSMDRLTAVLREGIAPIQRDSWFSTDMLIGTVKGDSFSVYSRSWWNRGARGAVLNGTILPVDGESCEVLFRVKPAIPFFTICIIGAIVILSDLRYWHFALRWFLIGFLLSLAATPIHANRTTRLMDVLINKKITNPRPVPDEEKEEP